MNKKQKYFAFLAYQTAIETYNQTSNRVSTRFNILLSINIALAGYFVDAWINNKLLSNNGSIVLPIIGFVLSLFLYFQSAQYSYIIKNQRKRINTIKDKILADLNLENLPCVFSDIDLTDSTDRKESKSFVFVNLLCWRSNILSITKIPGWISCVSILFWIVIVIMNWNVIF